MTVNELIEKLKEYGDEKARDMGKVRIVDATGNLVDDNIDIFDVKFDVHGVTIPANAFSSNNCGYEDDEDEDYWEDDDDIEDDELDDEDENDDEDYGWGQDSQKD